LYDNVLRSIEEGINLSSTQFTKNRLKELANLIYRKIEEKKAEIEK
jgi:hypothetical protein